MDSKIILFIDNIGYQGPIITSLITLFSLLGKPIYLSMFIIGSILNYSLNNILKSVIKEPRPIHPISYIDDHLIKGAQIYGMPSGHAQISSFAIMFLILTSKKRSLFIIISIFIYILTLVQRWKYRRHTIEQLIGGTVVGSLFSYCMFWITESYLQRTDNIKSLF